MAESIKFTNEGRDEKYGEYEKEIEEGAAKLFDKFGNSEKAAKELEKVIEIMFEAAKEMEVFKDSLKDELKPHIIAELKNFKGLEKADFVNKVVKLLKPLIDLWANNENQFEELQRVVFAGAGEKFIPLNEILSYGMYDDIVHIHFAPAKTLSAPEIISLTKEGLAQLARIIRDNEGIRVVMATSWIVAKNPGILEKLGFTVDGRIDEGRKEKYFKGETREVWEAHMDRQDFLDRYGKE